MNKSNSPIKAALLTGVLTLGTGVFFAAVEIGQAAQENGFKQAVGKNGTIRLPDVDFRKNWTALGTWVIAADEGTPGAEGINTVFTQPESVEIYRQTGRFPDGTILIKELHSTVTTEKTTGTVSRVDKTTGWFVMIKDSKGRYPNNPLWGDGWGWAHFDASDRLNTSSLNYVDDCKDCHIPAQKTDWVFIQGYPVLDKK